MFVDACAEGENQSAYLHLGYVQRVYMAILSIPRLCGKIEDGDVVLTSSSWFRDSSSIQTGELNNRPHQRQLQPHEGLCVDLASSAHATNKCSGALFSRLASTTQALSARRQKRRHETISRKESIE
jgi:hypothetical protein